MQSTRKRLFIIFFAISFILFFCYICYSFFIGAKYVYTDNAYAAGEIAQIMPGVPGLIKKINYTDAQEVKEGDVVVEIDDIDLQLAVLQAKAELAKSVAETENTKLEYERRLILVKTGSIAIEQTSNAFKNYKSAQAQEEFAKASLDLAEINLLRTKVKAPVSGIIAKRQVQLGQYVLASQNLLSIVPIYNLYVNANFKEVQLKKVKIGQEVELTSDIYGDSVIYKGKVEGIAGGSGSAFAIIPAQNATGNWIKVVQRVPVRISIDSEQLKQNPLPVGVSMTANINISR